MRFPDTAQVLNTAIPTTPVTNSINSITRREGGLMVSKVITLSASNTTASVNAFTVAGSVRVKKLYGIITTKTTLANLTVGSFDLYDGTNTVQITKADGVLSGFGIGTIFAKIDDNAVTWGVGDNSQVRLIENAGYGNTFMDFVAVQKVSTNTYIRFTYTTTDEPIAATITVYCEYIPLDSSSSVTAV